MELQDLEKKRDAYAGKITRLALHIAIIFAVPIAIAIGLHTWLNISYLILFPVAFIASWTAVTFLYRKIDKEVRELEARISELKKEEPHIN